MKEEAQPVSVGSTHETHPADRSPQEAAAGSARSATSEPSGSKLGVPRLPRRFYRRSTLGGLGFILFTVAMWWGGGGLAYLLLRVEGLPLGIALLGAAPFWFCSAQGVQLMGFVGHEGFHGSLFPSRRWSAAVGIVASAMTIVFFQSGVAIDHFNHHRYTNKPNDPDLELFGGYRWWLSRLLLARSGANRRFFGDTVRILLKMPIKQDLRRLPFKYSTYWWFALLNVVSALAWLCLYTLMGWYDSTSVICMVVVPLILGYLYSGIRPFLEHNFTDEGVVTCARSRCHPFFRVFYWGNSLHFEHHLYPAVPCYRLGRVHDWLIEGGHFGKDHEAFDNSLFTSYRWLLGRFQYGVKASPR